MKSFRIQWEILILLLSIMVSFWAYQPALTGPFLWDDDRYVSQNPHMDRSDGLWKIWVEPTLEVNYWPITHSIFWLEFQFFGLHSTGYHWVNWVLHMVNALLIYLLLKRWKINGGVWVSLLFILHPMNVETVAWISELKNILALNLCLLSLWCLLRHLPQNLSLDGTALDADTDDKSSLEILGGKHLILALLFFLLALLAKTSVCVFPVLIVILCTWRNGIMKRLDWIKLAPFFLLALVLTLHFLWIEKNVQTVANFQTHYDFLEKWLIFSRSFWFYPIKWIFPYPLATFYPQWSLVPTQFINWLPSLGLAVLTGLCYWSFRQKNKKLTYAVLAYLVSMLPVLGLIEHMMLHVFFVADHYFYFASIVIGLAAVNVLNNLAKKVNSALFKVYGVPTILIFALVVFSALSHQQAKKFAGDTLFWETQQKFDHEQGITSNYITYNNLASVYAIEKNYPLAFEYFQKSLALRPNDPLTYANLGMAYLNQGDYSRSQENFVKAIQYSSPNFIFHRHLGTSLLLLKQYDAALKEFEQAIQMQAEDADSQNMLGLTLMQLQRLDEARAAFMKALKLKRHFPAAYINLSRLFLQQGDVGAAAGALNKALEIEPNHEEALMARGVLNLTQNQAEQALQDFKSVRASSHRYDQEIIALYTKALNNLAVQKKNAGKCEEAITFLEEAIALTPKDEELWNNRGTCYLILKKWPLAIQDFNHALELKPNWLEVYSNRGIVYFQTEQFDLSLHDFNQAIQMNANTARPFVNRGLLQMLHFKNKKAACKDWLKACELGSCDNLEIARKQKDCT